MTLDRAPSQPGRRIKGATDPPDFDLAAWPAPDVGALSDDGLRDYLARKTAIELCATGALGEAIKAQLGSDSTPTHPLASS